jgi:hypothetical protein
MKMKELGRLLEETGHYGISAWTADALLLLKELAKRVETLKKRIKWTEELEKALEEVRRTLEGGVACVNC